MRQNICLRDMNFGPSFQTNLSMSMLRPRSQLERLEHGSQPLEAGAKFLCRRPEAGLLVALAHCRVVLLRTALEESNNSAKISKPSPKKKRGDSTTFPDSLFGRSKIRAVVHNMSYCQGSQQLRANRIIRLVSG